MDILSRTIQSRFQILVLLIIVSVSGGLVQNDLPPLFDDQRHTLDTLEYHHENQNTDSSLLNCSNYVAHHEYVLLQNGSLFLPELERVHEYETYFLQNDTAFLCPEEKEASTEYNFTKEFLTCGHLLIEPHEYKLLDNGDVYIEVYSKTYGPRDFYMHEDGIYVCMPDFGRNRTSNDSHHHNKFSDSFTYVTYAGLLISILSLMSHLVVFCLVASARNLPGCCLASLSLSLLMAYCFFLVVALVDKDDYSCPDLGMCIYYFFLTSFFWMNAIAFDVWRSFRSVMRELRISSHRVPWRRFLLYSVYSWSVPAILSILVKVFDSTDILPEDFKPYFGDAFCWFGQRKALLVFFATPLIVVMVLNAAFFLDVTFVISRSTLKTSHEASLRKRFFMFMRLALIMGLTWVVGLLAGYVDHPVFWYIFIVLNTLQGLFIFVVFSCSSKVKGFLCCGKYSSRNRKRNSTSVRTISQISAQV